MADKEYHSRRDFLQGKAAARSLADRVYDLAQEWVGSATELITDRFPLAPTLLVEATRRAMACEFSVCYHQSDQRLANDVLDALDLIEVIEDSLTIYRDDSDLIAINRQAGSGPMTVDSELFSLLELAAKLHEQTDGAFDITGTALSRCWGFLKRAGRLPSVDQIASALKLVGMSKIVLKGADCSIEILQPGVEINFNAMGKGYALDRAADLLDERGAQDFLWHGGRSSVLARGVNRGDDNQCWSVGLRDPLHPDNRLVEFHLRNQALGTSGGATQFFEYQGRRYSHILDPRTGWPASGVFTATVIAPTAAEADALSTAAYVLGPEKIAQLCQQRPDVGIVLVCPSKTELGITVFAGNMGAQSWTPLCDTRMMTVV